jgi:hypothetical protein
VRLDASSWNFLSFDSSLPVLICLLAVSGHSTYRIGMTMKLTEKTHELNATLLKIIKKNSLIERLSDQLESKPFTLISISPLF